MRAHIFGAVCPRKGVADNFQIDARWQTEAAQDEHTEMRYSTRASESAQPSF